MTIIVMYIIERDCDCSKDSCCHSNGERGGLLDVQNHVNVHVTGFDRRWTYHCRGGVARVLVAISVTKVNNLLQNNNIVEVKVHMLVERGVYRPVIHLIFLL